MITPNRSVPLVTVARSFLRESTAELVTKVESKTCLISEAAERGVE